MPTVSIGLPVYNGARFLDAAIRSVLEQDFSDLELVISDNGSTDDTFAICEAHARADARVRVERQPENRGAAYNYNRVFELSRGTYFKWHAHDDIIKPSYLSVCVDEFLRRDDDTSIVYPRAELIDENGRVLKSDEDRQRTLASSAPARAFEALQQMSFAASVFGLVDSRRLARTRRIGSFISSDYALLLELAILGKIVQLETEPLFQRRYHPGMSRLANKSKQDVLRWFDPRATSRLSERQRLWLEYAKAPLTLKGLDPFTRGACLASVVTGVAIKQGRVSVGRTRRQIGTAARRRLGVSAE